MMISRCALRALVAATRIIARRLIELLKVNNLGKVAMRMAKDQVHRRSVQLKLRVDLEEVNIKTIPMPIMDK